MDQKILDALNDSLLSEFADMWRVMYSHNLSMPAESRIDWEGIARECFLKGAHRGLQISDKVMETGSP